MEKEYVCCNIPTVDKELCNKQLLCESKKNKSDNGIYDNISSDIEPNKCTSTNKGKRHGRRKKDVTAFDADHTSSKSKPAARSKSVPAKTSVHSCPCIYQTAPFHRLHTFHCLWVSFKSFAVLVTNYQTWVQLQFQFQLNSNSTFMSQFQFRLQHTNQFQTIQFQFNSNLLSLYIIYILYNYM